MIREEFPTYPQFSVNTDTVDIDRRQIGIHAVETVAREYCAGVNHAGTKESVRRATDIARVMAAAPDLAACVYSFAANWPQFFEGTPEYDTDVNGGDLVDWFQEQAWYFAQALKKAGLA